jgi:hypothetical protein
MGETIGPRVEFAIGHSLAALRHDEGRLPGADDEIWPGYMGCPPLLRSRHADRRFSDAGALCRASRHSLSGMNASYFSRSVA